MLCLGIETSCDETGLALLEDGKIIASVLASQVDIHALFGGVIPEIASREHYRYCGNLCDQLLERSQRKLQDVDIVAVTRGPGLLGCLLVGMAFAKSLALALKARFIGVNHLHAHLLASGLEYPLEFPALGLLVSGGHTCLFYMAGVADLRLLGKTLDDAAGEIFDKTGKCLGLRYPAGALLDQLSNLGDAQAINFPRPYCKTNNLDFSFSGLKTAVCNFINKHKEQLELPFTDVKSASQDLKNVCAACNLAVVDTLLEKTQIALDNYPEINKLIVAGGVAANSLLRKKATELMAKRGGYAIFPSLARCTDNGEMIAYTGWLLAKAGWQHPLTLEPVPRGKAIPNDLQKIIA